MLEGKGLKTRLNIAEGGGSDHFLCEENRALSLLKNETTTSYLLRAVPDIPFGAIEEEGI